MKKKKLLQKYLELGINTDRNYKAFGQALFYNLRNDDALRIHRIIDMYASLVPLRLNHFSNIKQIHPKNVET